MLNLHSIPCGMVNTKFVFHFCCIREMLVRSMVVPQDKQYEIGFEYLLFFSMHLLMH